jgi:MFS family permease
MPGVTASTSALVADLSGAHGKGGAMGVLSSIMDIGQSAGPMISGILIGAFSYRATFGVVGVCLILAGLVFGFAMRRGAGNSRVIAGKDTPQASSPVIVSPLAATSHTRRSRLARSASFLTLTLI